MVQPENNPYLAPLNSASGEKPKQLGSLSQSARQGQLRSARIILILVGVLTAGFHLFFMSLAEKQVNEAIDGEVRQLQGQGMVFDQQELQKIRDNALRLTRMIHGAFIALGVIFVVLGMVVYAIPVPATVLGLVLYIGANAIVGAIDPSSLLSGALIKILIVIGLFKSVQAAVAYQREKANAESAAFGV
jgi:hypothetical protein